MSQIHSQVYKELIHNIKEVYSFFDNQDKKFSDLENNIFNSIKVDLRDFCNALEVAFLELEHMQFVLTPPNLPVTSLSFRIQKNLKTFESCEVRLDKISEYSGMLCACLSNAHLQRTEKIIFDYFTNLISNVYTASLFVI